MNEADLQTLDYRGTLLFDGDDLRLVVQDTGSDTVFVTFTPRPDVDRNKGFQKLGFAQKFAEKHSYSGVYIIAKWAHWYQTPELAQVEAIIHGLDFLARARHRISYGTSMGAFAVLLCSQRLGCQQAIAVAPQVSMDPSIVRFETRWADDVKKITFIEPDARDGIHDGCHYFVVYDRFHEPDRLHIDLLWHYPVTRLDLPFSGHNLLEYAVQTGMSDAFLTSFADDGIDTALAFQAVRSRRRFTTNYYEKLYAHCLQKGRVRYAGIVAQRWFVFDPSSASAFRKYARTLKDEQRHDDVLQLAADFEATGGEVISVRTVMRDALYSLKRYDDALAVNALMMTAQADDYGHVQFQLTAWRRLARNDAILSYCGDNFQRYKDRAAFLKSYVEALELAGHAEKAGEVAARLREVERRGA